MTTSAALVLLGLLATAGAAPWPSDVPKCARECSIAGAPKLAYKPEKTYSYSYTGFSEIHMKDVEGGVSKMEWTSEVDLTWLSPCDMAITFKNPSFDGTAPPEAHRLTRYPLVVAMTDGRVQNVCSHPEDDTWSINLKKGVASALQNTLPSNSTINNGLNVTETGINGKCPTHYLVERQGDKIVVEKKKYLRFCQQRFTTQFETPRAWHKAPLPMKESVAKCKQEITRGIYTSIVCEDKHIIKPFYGSYKYVKANQISKLEFRSESHDAPQAISNLQGHLLHRTLRFDHETLKKQPEKIPQMQQLWKEICEKTQHGVETEIAFLVDKVIHTMRRVPEEALEQMLQKVKSGEVCSGKQRVESLFLDALAFVQEASTVKLMVQEMLNGHMHGGRSALYTVALYLTPRPNIRAIEALKPLFERSERHPMAVLAAGTLVHTYCKHNPHCFDEAPVKQVAEILGQKVQQQCSPSAGEHIVKEALATLKALGNMGVLPQEVAQSVFRCMETKGVEKNVRVAAAQAFRNMKCRRHQETVKELVRFALNPMKDTEVRINAYLSAVKCATEEDLKEIIKKISKQDNTQVRGFILSHLLNLQESTAPRKEHLRYMLSSVSIPANFTKDIRKYSRNIDLSYYAHSLGVGAGVESNIIYAPGSFIPRSLTFNLSSAFGATPVNLGELGVRLEGLDPILKELFGPEGYFKKSSMNDIMDDVMRFIEEKGADIINNLQEHIRERRSIDLSTITHLLHKLYGERQFLKEPRADFFARFSGQEIAYASLAGNMHNINVDRMIEAFISMMKELLQNMSNMHKDTARMVQMDFDFALPTTQGIPLKMKMDGTVVLGLKMENRLGGMESVMQLKPSMSMQLNGFIGFDSFLAKCGVKTKNMIGSNNGVTLKIKREQGIEMELELPHKMELIDFKSETFLMKAARGQQETKIHPQGVRPVRIQKQHCFHSLAEKIGLQLCYDMNLPNIFQSVGLPLGPPSFAKLTLQKSDSSMRGYKLKVNSQGNGEMKHVKVEMETLGSSVPRKAEAVMNYQNQGEGVKISAAVATESSGGIKVELKSKWLQSEKELEFKAFSSQSMHFPPETEVFEAAMRSRNNGMESNIYVLTETKNSLKSYIDHRFEIRGMIGFMHRTGFPYPRRIEKFDFRTIVGHYKMISYIQKRGEYEYMTTLKVGSRHEDWFALEGMTNLEGNHEEGWKFKTVATVKKSHVEYKTAFDVFYTREKKGIVTQIVRLDENMKVVDFEVFLECPGQSHKAKFLLDIPRMMRAIKIEVTLNEQGNHQYELHGALKHGHQVILQVEGPLTAKFTREVKQLQADVRVSTLDNEAIRTSCTLILARNKQVLAFELKDQQTKTFAIEWNMSAENEHETKTTFKFFLPTIMDTKINAIISPRHIQVSFNNLISPKSSSSRRVKGFADVDFENKKGKADLYWDADRDQNKKISAELSVISSMSNPHQTAIHGGWNYEGSQFHYKTEISCSHLDTWLQGRKDIKVELSTPSQRTYALETVLQVELQSSGAKVDAEIMYRNPENKEQKVKSQISMESLGRPFNFKINSRFEHNSPQGRHSSLNLQVKHEKSSGQRNAYLQIQLTCPSMNKPIQTSFELMNQGTSYKAKWEVDVKSPAEAVKWELNVTPEGGVQKCEVGLNMREIVALLKACYKLAGMNYESGMENENGRPSYMYQYERRNPHHDRRQHSGEYGTDRSSENRNSNERNDYNSQLWNTNRRSSGENSNERSENINTHGWVGNHKNGGQWDAQNSGENKRRSSENTNSNEENNYNTGEWNRRRRSSSENSQERSGNLYFKGNYNSGENRRGSSENMNSNENLNSNSQGWNRNRRSSGENRNERPENLNLYGMSNKHQNKNRWNEQSSSEYGRRSSENRNSNEQENYNSKGWNRNRRSSGENSNERPENLNLYGMSNKHQNKNRWNEQSSSENGRSSENINSNEQENYNSQGWNRNRRSSGENSNERPENLNLYGMSNENQNKNHWNEQSSSEYGRRSSENRNSNEQENYNSKGWNRNRRSSGENSNERPENLNLYGMSNEHHNKNRWNEQSSSENGRRSPENINSNEQENYNSRKWNRNRRSSGENSNERPESLSLYGQQNENRRWNDQSSSESRRRSSENTNSNEQQDSNSRERNMNRRYSGEDSNERQGNNRRNKGYWNSNENRRGSSENMNSNEPNFNSRDVNVKRRSGNSFEYLIHYEKPTQTTHRVHFKTPSRTLEGEVNYSPSEYSVRIYPNKHQNENRYEIALYSGSPRSGECCNEMKYEGRFNHPGLQREKRFEILYSRNEQKVQGTIILDLFVRPEDKITGQLQSTKMSRDTIRVEAKLVGNPLKMNPRIILNAAYSPHTVGFDFEFEKHPSSRPSLIISGKYDRSSGRNAAMAFIVKTEQGPVFDISAAVKPEHEGDCSGVKISALAKSVLIGKYEIFTKLCKPGFVKITTKKHGSDKVYITRAGLEELKNLELSITEKDERSQEYKYISLTRVRLMSPTMVHLEAKCEHEKASMIWNIFTEKTSELYSAATSWMDYTMQEILKEGGNAPSEELARLWREVKEEAWRIYEELIHEKLISSYESLERLLRNQLVEGVVSGYKGLWRQVQNFHRNYCQEIVPRVVSAIKHNFETVTEVVNGVVFGGARWMMTAEMPEELNRLVERTYWPFLAGIKKWIEELLSNYSEEYQAMENMMVKVRETLKRDMEKMREKLMEIPKVKEMVTWVLHNLHLERMVTHKVEHVISKVVQEVLFSSLEIKNGRLEIQIPIRRPVHSLTQALRYMEPNPIPVPENLLRWYETLTLRSVDFWVWSYYAFLPKHASYLLPPYNRTAMLVDGSEILTFDRSVLRTPLSPCKVLLVAYKSNSLIMEHPHSSHNPQLTLKTQVGNVVIKPDFKVIVDGSEMNGNHENKGMMQIWKNEDKIKIATPFMILRAYPKNNVISVEMNGWTFGHVAGLMGTFDGEKANDWYTPQGTKAPNMQELVKSWQENQSCQTPHIAPIDAAHTPSLRTIQCQALLGVKSRCNPVVRPDPFMKMCYASRNACDVAMAYHHLCSTKGVKDVFPLAC